MKPDDLQLTDLLHWEPEGGMVRFAGQRALILDTLALGLVRKELIDALGFTAAQGILTRFGFAHGWRTAENLKRDFPWDSERDWQLAGGRLHGLQGMATVEVPPWLREDGIQPFAHCRWLDSYEAEQHVLQVGPAQDPVCWTLTGFASGYMSCCHGRRILCVETKCRARGDAYCSLIGNPDEDWGEKITEIEPYFQGKVVEECLRILTSKLKNLENRIKQNPRIPGISASTAYEPEGFFGVVKSDVMQKCVQNARRASGYESTVLVLGESGSGKEKVARFIHLNSTRSQGPFLAINCGAISESLLESELFGHAKNAFTGAHQDRIGLFEAAHNGTLFLDEIGELPLSIQVKLLRVIQEREIRRLGENRNRAINVRLIAATHRDLQRAVEEEKFRLDLLYRLKVIEIKIPPLRNRLEDIIPLAHFFIKDFCSKFKKEIKGLHPQAMNAMLKHPWTGNIRELQNAMERAVIFASGNQIGLDDIQLMHQHGAHHADPFLSGEGSLVRLADLEKSHILKILASHKGNQLKTAAALGIGIATLYRKLRQYRDDDLT